MCKGRALTFGKPYNLYSGVDAAGSVLFYEPVNPYYLVLRCLCAFYATAVIVWSMADLAVHDVSYSLWFAFRINWVSLLIWGYFVSSLLISLLVNNVKRRGQSLTIPSFTEWEPDHDDAAGAAVDYRDLRTYHLFWCHQLSRICFQLAISSVVMVSILYFVDFHHVLDTAAIPKVVLNLQTHGVLAVALIVDYLTSCLQIRYTTGTLLVVLFNAASLGWTYFFYRADLYNPLTESNILYPIADWTGGLRPNLYSIAEVWIAGTLAQWVVHMAMVYLKFVVICHWIDRRRFTMDIVDEKEGRKKKRKRAAKAAASIVDPRDRPGHEFTPLLL